MKKLTLNLGNVKYVFCILLCTAMFSMNAVGQTKLNEKQIIRQKHIDFSKEVIYFELSGLIEIDGHILNNDTSIIIYTANLEGISIFNKITNQKYNVRKCERNGCKIIHLVKEQDLIFNNQWQNKLHFNSIPCIIND